MVLAAHVSFLVFALSLVSGVPVINTDPPNYLNAVEDYKKATDKLVSLVPDDYVEADVTSPKVHYGLLISVLSDITQALVNDDSKVYNEYYLEGVKNGLLHGFNDSAAVGQRVRNLLSKLHDAIEELVELVEKTCHDPNVLNCDEVVAKTVKEDPKKYLLANNLLLQVAELSKEYLTNTYEKEAETYEIVKTLIVDGKDKLRKLVQALTLGRKALDLFQINGTSEESGVVRSAVPLSRYGMGPFESPVVVAPVWRSDVEPVGITDWKSGVRPVETPVAKTPVWSSDVRSAGTPVVTSIWSSGVGDVRFSDYKPTWRVAETIEAAPVWSPSVGSIWFEGGTPVWRAADTPEAAPVWSSGVENVRTVGGTPVWRAGVRDVRVDDGTPVWRSAETHMVAPVWRPAETPLKAPVSHRRDMGSVGSVSIEGKAPVAKEVKKKKSDEEDDEVVGTIIGAALALLRPVVVTVVKQLLQGNSSDS